jgi:hypothetical protein
MLFCSSIGGTGIGVAMNCSWVIVGELNPESNSKKSIPYKRR